jgi:hypothetical protein
MRKNASIPVRLDPDIESRIDRMSVTLRMSKSAIIRMLLEEFVTHCERHGGRIVMPPEFKDFDIREATRSEPLRHAADAGPEYGTRKKGAKP